MIKNRNVRYLKFNSWIDASAMNHPFALPGNMYYAGDEEKHGESKHYDGNGGIIVFPRESGIQNMPDINAAAYESAGTIFRTGHFFTGRYSDHIKAGLFNNDCFAIEIKGLNSESLMDFAAFIMKSFSISVLMLKDLNTGIIFLYDNPYTDKRLNIK